MKPLSEQELRKKIHDCFKRSHMQSEPDIELFDTDITIDEIVKLILQDRKAWGEQEHRAGYVRGISDFSGWYMDASTPAQRVPIMPDIAKDLIDSYAPPTYTEQMFERQRNQGEKTDGTNEL